MTKLEKKTSFFSREIMDNCFKFAMVGNKLLLYTFLTQVTLPFI